MPIEISRAAREDEVAAFVEGAAGACAYHQPVFARLVRAAGHAVATFVSRPARGAPIEGILPVACTRSLLFGRYATSLPFFNYGGVLAPGRDEAARALVDAAWAWARARGARHLILRHTADRPLPSLPASHGKETLTLALPPTEAALFAAIGSKTRNLVRKAQKSSLTVSEEGAAGLGAFHAVYAERLRDLGTPSLPEAFFRMLAREVGPRARVHVVRSGPHAAAAAITIRFRDRVEVPWAACRERYNASSANMLLYWHLLDDARAQGGRVFDFGRSTPGSGPYKFKLQWGARPEPLPWYFVSSGGGAAPAGDLSPSNPRYALAIRMWQRLPLGVARTLGGVLSLQLP